MLLPFVNDHNFTAKRKMLEIYNNYPLYNLVPANFLKWVNRYNYKNILECCEISFVFLFYFYRTTIITIIIISIMSLPQILITMVYLQKNQMVNIQFNLF